MNRIVALLATVDAALAVAVSPRGDPRSADAPVGLRLRRGAADRVPSGRRRLGVAARQPRAARRQLPPEYLAATGIDAQAASFILSLSPLAFAGFHRLRGAFRAASRASRARPLAHRRRHGDHVGLLRSPPVPLTAQNSIAMLRRGRRWSMPTLLFAIPPSWQR